MDTLNKVVGKYLEANGITAKFFAKYIGCEYSLCTRWLNGERELKPGQLRKVHEFIEGKFLKSLDEIIKGE